MDYRYANTADIPALVDAVGGLLAGAPAESSEAAEKRWWARLGDDRRTVIFEEDEALAAYLVYRPVQLGFDVEEFATTGGPLVAREAFRLLLDEILAPTARVVVSAPARTPEATQFWRSQGFEADRVTLALSDSSSQTAANDA